LRPSPDPSAVRPGPLGSSTSRTAPTIGGLPNASFIGFTGTPIELTDASTRSVFGDYVSIYDIQRAVKDGATVPIFYESRLAKLSLDEREKPTRDPEFEEATEGEESAHKEKLKTKWAALETLVGSD
jgi:type I restriction enzyme, R subunit